MSERKMINLVGIYDYFLMGEIEPREHPTGVQQYGLNMQDIRQMIQSYESDKEILNDLIFNGGNGIGLQGKEAHLLEAWMKADTVLSFCKDFLDALNNLCEDAKYTDEKEQEEMNEPNT